MIDLNGDGMINSIDLIAWTNLATQVKNMIQSANYPPYSSEFFEDSFQQESPPPPPPPPVWAGPAWPVACALGLG